MYSTNKFSIIFIFYIFDSLSQIIMTILFIYFKTITFLHSPYFISFEIKVNNIFQIVSYSMDLS